MSVPATVDGYILRSKASSASTPSQDVTMGVEETLLLILAAVSDLAPWKEVAQ